MREGEFRWNYRRSSSGLSDGKRSCRRGDVEEEDSKKTLRIHLTQGLFRVLFFSSAATRSHMLLLGKLHLWHWVDLVRFSWTHLNPSTIKMNNILHAQFSICFTVQFEDWVLRWRLLTSVLQTMTRNQGKQTAIVK